MAEAYVPIGTYNTVNSTLTSLEVTTNLSSTNTTALAAAKASALASKVAAEATAASKFDLLVFVGA
jgi:hypothetical protein